MNKIYILKIPEFNFAYEDKRYESAISKIKVGCALVEIELPVVYKIIEAAGDDTEEVFENYKNLRMDELLIVRKELMDSIEGIQTDNKDNHYANIKSEDKNDLLKIIDKALSYISNFDVKTDLEAISIKNDKNN